MGSAVGGLLTAAAYGYWCGLRYGSIWLFNAASCIYFIIVEGYVYIEHF